MNIYLNIVLVVFAAILKPHKNVLKIVKLTYRGFAVSIAGFITYKIFPLAPGATSEVFQGLVPWPMLAVTVSYLILMYAGILIFWQVADNCTIQLKSRFNVDP